MKLLHTSDWHLGHSLHGRPRIHEHQAFLTWLLETIEARGIDALLIAGDIFDSANPPALAQKIWYEFLANARRRFPQLDMVIIGGNHDSAARLDAPLPLLKAFNIHMVGGAGRHMLAGEYADLMVPLHGKDGQVEAWCAAIPYLRSADLPAVPKDVADPLIAGVKMVYQRALEALKAKAGPNQALVAMGHCYMVGTTLCELSERRILGGNQHALPHRIFDEALDYVALGHLHKAQRVGKEERLRYSGSPIPLSLAEAAYKHQVLEVDLVDGHLQGVIGVPIPRAVEMLRLPRAGAQSLDAVLDELRALPEAEGDGVKPFPYLEVRVHLHEIIPDLRAQIEGVLENKAVDLLKITTQYGGSGETLADAVEEISLKEMKPEAVLEQEYRRRFGDELPDVLRQTFAELVENLREGGAQ